MDDGEFDDFFHKRIKKIVLDDNTSFQVKLKILDSDDCDKEILNILAKDKDSGIRCYIAETIDDIQIIKRLTRDTEANVRCAIASNPNTPIKCLFMLANDCEWCVRYQLINRFNCPREIVLKLINDKNEQILETLMRILKNTKDVQLLVEAYKKSKNNDIRNIICTNPYCPEKYIKK